MSISSTGLYGSATIVNRDLFNDVESLKEQVTTLSTSYLTTTKQHRDDISQNRLDISLNARTVRCCLGGANVDARVSRSACVPPHARSSFCVCRPTPLLGRAWEDQWRSTCLGCLGTCRCCTPCPLPVPC